MNQLSRALRQAPRGLLRSSSLSKPPTSVSFAPLPRVTRLCSGSERHLSNSASSRAALASSLPAEPTVILLQPTQADIEKEELDVELLPPEEVKLDITDRAAEVR